MATSHPILRGLPMVGLYFRPAEVKATVAALVGRTTPNGRVRLEPTNEHDAHAVQVLLPNGTHIGYVPRTVSAALTFMFKRAGITECEVTLAFTMKGKNPEVEIHMEAEEG